MSTPPRILVIDDTLLVRKMAEGILQKAGYDIRSAANAAEGRGLWSEWRPDLVLLDLTMPDASGWDVLTEMKARAEGRDIPVFILSGDEDPHSPWLAAENGAAGFVPKPFSAEGLLETIRNALSRA